MFLFESLFLHATHHSYLSRRRACLFACLPILYNSVLFFIVLGILPKELVKRPTKRNTFAMIKKKTSNKALFSKHITFDY